MPDRFDLAPLTQSETGAADALFRQAFGAFLRVPDPTRFRQGAAIFAPRLAMYPDGVCRITLDGRLVGAAVANRQGTIGVLGPVVVAPDCWGQGVGKRLVEWVMGQFAAWQCPMLALSTFPHSPMHLLFYQRYGFWPGTLLATMTRTLKDAPAADDAGCRRLSSLPEPKKEAAIDGFMRLADTSRAGWDLGRECRLLGDGRAGDVVFIEEDGACRAFAICVAGDGSEAGIGNCLVKVALATPGDRAPTLFALLMRGVAAYARERELATIIATVDTGRHACYRAMLDRGFVVAQQSLAMHRPWQPLSDQDTQSFVLADLR